MKSKRLSLALAACTVWAAACLAFGDENSTAVPVVYLKSTSPSTAPVNDGEIRGRLLEELARQSFLVAARDELGLRTRDASLGDEMPGGGDNAPFAVAAEFGSHSRLVVRRGLASPRKTVLDKELRAATVSEKMASDRSFTSIDYRVVLTELEEFSRGGFVAALRQAGFEGKPHVLKDSAGVPPKIEKSLEKLDFVSQFSAVRALHELMRVDGESPQRLGALARGYANLGLLTEFHWQAAPKAFKARALVYAQRMVARDKQPWRALWHRAYALALAGLHQSALDDLQTAALQWQAANGHHVLMVGGPRPRWVDLLDAYCRFAHARLKTAGAEGPEKDLAWLLWFDSIQHSGHDATRLNAALETLQQIPDCYPALQALCTDGGVRIGHVASSAPLVIVGKTLYPRVLAATGLPPAVAKIARAAGENSEADDELPVKEFALRAKLIRALLESDGSVAPQAAGAAPPAQPPAAAVDPGEPTWVCLGRMVSNLSFVHVRERTYFLAYQLGVPSDEFTEAAAPLVEAHPYRQSLVASVTDRPTRLRLYLAVASPQDLTPRDYYIWAHYALATDNAFWSAVLLRVSPYSPVGPALGVEFCGDDYKSHFGEWEKMAAEYPAVAMAFARRDIAAARWEQAEKWLKLVTASGDVDAFKELANVYGRQGKWDLWVATLEDSLKCPDFGLWQATVHNSIARYYMHDKQWEKALPHAKAAAESYSAWGLMVLAECAEAAHKWTAAETIYKAIGERYPTSGVSWYDFCRRTGHGDLDAARRQFAGVVGPTKILASREALVYYLLEKDAAKAGLVLQALARDGNPAYDLHVAVLSDQAHDNATRDKILARVRQKAAQYHAKNTRQSYANFAALAGLIVDDLAKGGKGEIDVAAAERLNPPQPFEDNDKSREAGKSSVAFSYLLGCYLDQHGKPQLAVRCWKRCLEETEFIAEFHRTLAAAELLAHGIRLEAEKPRGEKDEEKPKPTP